MFMFISNKLIKNKKKFPHINYCTSKKYKNTADSYKLSKTWQYFHFSSHHSYNMLKLNN